MVVAVVAELHQHRRLRQQRQAQESDHVRSPNLTGAMSSSPRRHMEFRIQIAAARTTPADPRLNKTAFNNPHTPLSGQTFLAGSVWERAVNKEPGSPCPLAFS
ncbi:unnamed protein product [Lampetra planeri]